LAYIADTDEGERETGKTVECSKFTFSIRDRRFTLFDAPGHKNYVPNMIMGACQCDIAVLILSAKEGEFESGFEKGGQTKEHAMLARALGVQSMIAVVTKMSTVGWAEARYSLIRKQV
jgi:peptide chain release factor subunit 3